MAASGGHSTYLGNEVYAFALNTATPRWHRITDPTPLSYIDIRRWDKGFNDAPTTLANLDGRMRCPHTWNSAVFANGKVWYTTQQAVGVASGVDSAWAPGAALPSNIDSGPTGKAIWSWDRSFATGQSWPIAHTLANTGGWTYHQQTTTTLRDGHANVPDVYDPVSNSIWGPPTDGAENLRRLNLTTMVETSFPIASGGSNGAAVFDPVSRCVIWLRDSTTNIEVVDVSNPAAPVYSARQASNTMDWGRTGTNYNADGSWQIVLHEASRQIIAFDPGKATAGAVRAIQLPTNPRTDTWGAWQSVAQAGVVPTYDDDPLAGGRPSSRFNIVQDIGNGDGVLICASRYNGPTYVMRVPTSGII
jgi:hypothetical protein